MPDLGMKELDKLFCMNGKKYGLPKLFLKAIAQAESAYNQAAYRFEPVFWQKYLKDNPAWQDKDPAQVSASWGLMQLMYVTAWELGFRGTGEELCNPVVNIALGAKLIRKHLDRMFLKENMAEVIQRFPWLSPLQIAAARYNGGSYGNPDEKGRLRNVKYVRRVFGLWDELRKKEEECDTSD